MYIGKREFRSKVLKYQLDAVDSNKDRYRCLGRMRSKNEIEEWKTTNAVDERTQTKIDAGR